MTTPPELELRLSHHEAALLDLADRAARLERALAFEVGQREAIEEIIRKLTGLLVRVDRIEAEARSARRRSSA